MGAIGSKAVQKDLKEVGYNFVELERGATDTKIWKDVKRKRVRIPDLVCTKTGQRIESRTKTKKPEITMSHSPDEAERAWDFGMIDEDWVAVPACVSLENETWSSGKLEDNRSYFHSREWEQFEQVGKINYFTVENLREVQYTDSRRKGMVEASEFSIQWDAKFSTRNGPVRYVEHDLEKGDYKVSIENSEGRAYTWRVNDNLNVLVEEGYEVSENEVFASSVNPIEHSEQNIDRLNSEQLRSKFLKSNERTMRFTGVKLARLRQDDNHISLIRDLKSRDDEDQYVVLEALSYLASVNNEPVRELFGPYINSGVNEDALEAVICIGEVGNEPSIQVLGEILDEEDRPYFLRSAAAWALGQINDTHAQELLVRTFSDQDLNIREQALQGLVSLGDRAVPKLLEYLENYEEYDDEVLAGCAEALRQYRDFDSNQLEGVINNLRGEDPSNWSVWLIGNLPKDVTSSMIQSMQDIKPEIHFGLSLLWSFSQSWISRRWEKDPLPYQSDIT